MMFAKETTQNLAQLHVDIQFIHHFMCRSTAEFVTCAL